MGHYLIDSGIKKGKHITNKLGAKNIRIIVRHDLNPIAVKPKIISPIAYIQQIIVPLKTRRLSPTISNAEIKRK